MRAACRVLIRGQAGIRFRCMAGWIEAPVEPVEAEEEVSAAEA